MPVKWTAAIPIVVVIALGLGGAAYAAWTTSLSLVGLVRTGDVGAVWNFVETRQFIGGRDAPIPDAGAVDCTAEIEPGAPAHRATFAIRGAFPSYVCEIVLGAQVTGVVPVAANGIRTSAFNAAGIDVLGRDLVVEARLTGREASGGKGGGCRLTDPLPPGTKFAQGDTFCVVVGVQVTRAIRVGSGYEVTMEMDLVQWNLAQ